MARKTDKSGKAEEIDEDFIIASIKRNSDRRHSAWGRAVNPEPDAGDDGTKPENDRNVQDSAPAPNPGNTPGAEVQSSLEIKTHSVPHPGVKSPAEVQSRPVTTIPSGSQSDYERLFVREPDISVRSGKIVYVREEFHNKMRKIIQVTGEGRVSLSGYVDNVLAHHFDTYREEIIAAYDSKYNGIY